MSRIPRSLRGSQRLISSKSLGFIRERASVTTHVAQAECAVCGEAFVPLRRTTRTCGAECRARLSNIESTARRRERRAGKTCETCGVAFDAPRSDSRHCSPRCRGVAAYRATRPDSFTLTCGYCHRPFEWPTKRPLYCSRHCGRLATYDRHADARRAYSRAWNAANSDTEAYRAANQAKYHRRRAWKLAAGGAGVSLWEWRGILNRARGMCAYCGQAGALTMEHVIPLSRGGTHSPGNVVAACSPCNYSKSGRLLVEWRLRQARAAA